LFDNKIPGVLPIWSHVAFRHATERPKANLGRQLASSRQLDIQLKQTVITSDRVSNALPGFDRSTENRCLPIGACGMPKPQLKKKHTGEEAGSKWLSRILVFSRQISVERTGQELREMNDLQQTRCGPAKRLRRFRWIRTVYLLRGP